LTENVQINYKWNSVESKKKSIGAEVCTLQYLPHLHALELDYGRREAKGCSIGPHNSWEHFKKLYVTGCSSTLKHDHFKELFEKKPTTPQILSKQQILYIINQCCKVCERCFDKLPVDKNTCFICLLPNTFGMNAYCIRKLNL
jgi:hypothetical protein